MPPQLRGATFSSRAALRVTGWTAAGPNARQTSPRAPACGHDPMRTYRELSAMAFLWRGWPGLAGLVRGGRAPRVVFLWWFLGRAGEETWRGGAPQDRGLFFVG